MAKRIPIQVHLIPKPRPCPHPRSLTAPKTQGQDGLLLAPLRDATKLWGRLRASEDGLMWPWA